MTKKVLAMKSPAIERIAKQVGYKGNIRDRAAWGKYLQDNPDAGKLMRQYEQYAHDLAKKNKLPVRKFQAGGLSVENPTNQVNKPVEIMPQKPNMPQTSARTPDYNVGDVITDYEDGGVVTDIDVAEGIATASLAYPETSEAGALPVNQESVTQEPVGFHAGGHINQVGLPAKFAAASFD